VAAFTEAERVQIRRYLGFSRLRTQYNPLLESAITSVQSEANGGSLPTADTETLIRSLLASLVTLESKLVTLWSQAAALAVDEVKVDPVRAAMFLRSEGRRLVTALSHALDTPPRADVFSSTAPVQS
jgi:hypothetical protein